MRPNLMSPRRAASSGEASILAMLERETTHKRGNGASGGRLAWYGASAAVAVALTGALVWLVANNDGLGRDVQDTVLADAGKAAPRGTATDGPAPPPGAGAALIQVAMAPPAPAVIVDQRPTPDGVPPLRLLKPPPARPAPVPVPVAAAKPAPRAVPAAPVEARAPVRPAAVAATAKPKPALAARSAARPAPPKAQRGATPARAPEAVDADVALISAVIVHANGHAPEGSQMTELLCPNGACQARPASQ